MDYVLWLPEADVRVQVSGPKRLSRAGTEVLTNPWEEDRNEQNHQKKVSPSQHLAASATMLPMPLRCWDETGLAAANSRY